MSLIGLASKCGITTSSLQSLISGTVPISVGGKLGVVTASLQTFVNGGTSITLASKLGILSSSLQELRKAIGKEGAIGLLIGMMSSGDHA